MKNLSRKATAIILTAALAAGLTACVPKSANGDDEVNTATGSLSEADSESAELPPNTFMLNRLPSIGEYSGSDETYTRLSPERIPVLTPRADYGTLVPFVGSKLSGYFPDMEEDEDSFYYGDDMSMRKYGLCTEDGKIVLDALYDSIYPVTDFEGKSCGYYTATRNYDVNPDTLTSKTQTYLIKSDGSEVYNLGGYSLTSIVDGGYIAYSGDVQSGDRVSAKYIGFDGKVIAETPTPDKSSQYSFGSVGAFADNGLAAVTFSEYTNDTNKNSAYYIDKSGSTVLAGYNDALEFSKYGYAVVGISEVSTDDNGETYKNTLYGMINDHGEWILEPEYEYITTSKKHTMIILKRGGSIYLADSSSADRIHESFRTLVNEEDDNPYGVAFIGKDEDILSFYSYLDGSVKLEYIDAPEEVKAQPTARLDETTGLYMLRSNELDTGANIQAGYGADVFLCYDYDTNTATYIDKLGNTIITLEDIENEYYNTIDDRFCSVYADDNYNSCHVFDYTTGKYFGILDGTVNQSFAGRYLIIFKSVDTMPYDGSFSVFDTETGEYILEGLESISTIAVDGADYVLYDDGSYLYTADGGFNTIVKMRADNKD